MPKLKIKKILAGNPRVDAKKLFEVLGVLRKLRKKGLSKNTYDLDIPFTRRVHARTEDHF